MPKIVFDGQEIECDVGDNLRRVLMRYKLPLYNGAAVAIHCRGLGTCGTCAVEVDGEVTKKTSIESWRLNFPPHDPKSKLRLACQCKVFGDLVITKHKGLWGQCTDEKSTS